MFKLADFAMRLDNVNNFFGANSTQVASLEAIFREHVEPLLLDFEREILEVKLKEFDMSEAEVKLSRKLFELVGEYGPDDPKIEAIKNHLNVQQEHLSDDQIVFAWKLIAELEANAS